MDVEEFNRPYWLLPHHLSSNAKPEVIPCMPSTVEHDNCLGNDQLLVSAMMNDINCDVSLHSTCWINVVECIFLGKDLSSSHEYLQSRYEKVLGGTTTSEVFTKPSKKMMYLEDVDEWESEHLLLDDILLQKANKIMLVDWLHESFPTYIPDDFLILENHDLKHLGFMLKNNPFNIKFFHQLGLLQCYLDSAPEGSEDAHIYRRLPMVSRPFAYECSNLCSDIFSTAGRNNTIKSSKLFVVESEVMENVYLDMVKSDMKGVNLVPSKNKNKKTIQWILDDDVVDILPKPFINSLMHGVWQPLSKEEKNKLAKYSNNRSHSYRKADELTVVSLHPYQAYFEGSTNENKSYSSIIGLDETQNIISDAFNHDSLPFEKIMDKMTNACFQDHVSTRLSRRKEEPLQKRATRSSNAKDERRFWMMGLPHDTDTEIPDSFFRELATATHKSQRKSPRTKTRDEYQKSVEPKKTVKVSKKKSGCWAEDDQLTTPSTIKFCDYVFPISVDPDRRNCLLGNTINLLDYLDHLDDSLSRGINEVILASGSMTDIKQILRRHGYCILNLPSFLTYPELTAFVQGLSLPMLINVQLPGVQAEHVVGIAPYKVSETQCVQYHLIDGSHPLRQPMEYSRENMDWCFDEFEKTLFGICFLPLAARSLEIVNSNGFEPRPGRPVCLAHDDAIPPSFGLRNVATRDQMSYMKVFKSLVKMFRQRKLVN